MVNGEYKLNSTSENRLKNTRLSLTKTASVEKYDSVNLGDKIKYTITIKNNATSSRTAVVSDTIPDYTSYVSGSLKNCSINGKKISCTKTIEKGKTLTISYEVTVGKNMNYLGKNISSDKATVNNIPLKKIYTKINKTLTSSEKTTIAKNAKSDKSSYNSSKEFITNMYKKLGYNLDILSATEVFNNLFVAGKYSSTDSESTFYKYMQEPLGVEKRTFNLKKRENVSKDYQKYYDTYVENLFGGIYTLSQAESGNTHYRNTTYTTKTLMPGDILYIYDSNYANDLISKKSGYIVSKENSYLYLGDGEFATVKNSKVYIYDKNNDYEYYFYNKDRSKIEKIVYPENGKISIGQRLLISLIGQDSFIVLRPSYSIKDKITDFDITQVPTKISYIQNFENVDLSGGKVKLYYGNYGNKEVNMTSLSFKVEGFNNKTLGKNTVTLNYNGIKKTFDVNIVKKSLNSISVNTKPTKLKYVQNKESLDLAGGKLTLKYDDKTTSVINMTSSNVKVSGFNNSKTGKNKITLDYLGKKISFEVEIISLKVSSISISNPISKLEYLESYEKLDLKNGSILVKYNDGSTKVLPLNDQGVSVSGFNNSKPGTQNITVTYGGVKTNFEVVIKSKTLTGISMDKLPSKTKYIKSEENLDLSGGTIKANYNNHSSEIIKLDSPNVSVSGFNNNKTGNNTINVNYKNMKTSFKVEIIEASKRNIVSIGIDKLPTKKVYTQGKEKLDLNGGKILVKYSDGSSETINMTSSNIKSSGFNNSKTGKNKIILDYLGKEVSFEVEIKQRKVVSVEVNKLPEKETVSENEEVDLSGGSISVKYSDNSTENIELTSPNVTIVDETDSEDKKDVVIDYLGYKDTFKLGLTKLVSGFDIIEDDMEIDYSEYGVFYDAVGMKPNEVITTIVAIFGLSILLFVVMKFTKVIK